MKQIFTLVFSLLSLSSIAQVVYPGNNKTGFGGPVGVGSLTIDMVGTVVTISHMRGTGSMNDALVVYIDAGTGNGFTSTANFNDASTALTRAISGFDGGTNRSPINFVSSFAPEFALAMLPNNSEGALFVQLGSAFHVPLATPTLTNNGNTNAAEYSVSIDLAPFGVTGPFMFQFVGTLVSPTGYRSDEAIGMSMDGFTQGWNPYTQTTQALVFAGNLPVVLSDFNGQFRGQSAQLSWRTRSESNTKSFIVEKSRSGAEWIEAGTVPATNRAEGSQYTYTDNGVSDKVVFYRLKMVDNDGSFKLSNVIRLQAGAKANIVLMGNPVKDVVRLQISNEKAASYTVQLLAADGRVINTVSYQHTSGSSTVSVPVKTGAGNCFIRVISQDQVTTLPVVIN